MAEWIEINEPQVQSSMKTARATLKFLVKSDRAATESTILSEAPSLGSQHPRFSWLFCTSRRVERAQGEGHTTWRVDIEYEVREKAEKQENPLNDPILISWSSQQYSEVRAYDIYGNPIVNSAGFPFASLPPITVAGVLITIRRNYANIPSWILNYVNAVNNAVWTVDGVSIAAGAAKVENINISEWQFRG